MKITFFQIGSANICWQQCGWFTYCRIWKLKAPQCRVCLIFQIVPNWGCSIIQVGPKLGPQFWDSPKSTDVPFFGSLGKDVLFFRFSQIGAAPILDCLNFECHRISNFEILPGFKNRAPQYSEYRKTMLPI